MPDDDAPASEKFDLTAGMSFDLTAADAHDLAADLEQHEAADAEDMSDSHLAEWVDALKRLEDAAEDARKEAFEAELETRVDVGDSVGPVTRQRGANTWVSDAEGAFAAVADRGEDPLAVASVSIGDLRDVLGGEADEYIGESEYDYFRRQS